MLENDFECAWESLGPVPTVSIDFGNGETLETTLGGNVLTSICTPEGAVFDVLPGVVEPATYLTTLTEARDLLRKTKDQLERVREQRVRDYPLRDKVARTWLEYIRRQSKDVKLASMDPLPFQPPTPEPLTVLGRKNAVELPIMSAIASPDELRGLARDERMVTTFLRPQARAILASLGQRSPDDVTPHVYRLVLRTDLGDPYLGLGQSLLGVEDPDAGRASARGTVQ